MLVTSTAKRLLLTAFALAVAWGCLLATAGQGDFGTPGVSHAVGVPADSGLAVSPARGAGGHAAGLRYACAAVMAVLLVGASGTGCLERARTERATGIGARNLPLLI